jgi:hypothetical protein
MRNSELCQRASHNDGQLVSLHGSVFRICCGIRECAFEALNYTADATVPVQIDLLARLDHPHSHCLRRIGVCPMRTGRYSGYTNDGRAVTLVRRRSAEMRVQKVGMLLVGGRSRTYAPACYRFLLSYSTDTVPSRSPGRSS